jgi:formate dehydrogenase major subunit/NADH-quinone oxidoreductase subunit G
MKTVTITINGKKITAPEGESLLWVALDNGIYIPHLCAIRERAEPAAACRLCFVEIEGKEQPVTACTETVTDGMVVNTKGEKALRLARVAFELIMAFHPVDCANCTANRNCELQVIARHLKTRLKPKNMREIPRNLPIDDSNPYFIYDPNKCVLCGRCIWECREHHGIGTLGFAHRGFERVVTTFADGPIGELGCRECIECVNVCPTGALVLRDKK